MQTETKQNKRSGFFPFSSLIAVLFALVFLVTACGRNREEPTPIPTPTPLFDLEDQNASDSSAESGQSDTGQSETGQSETGQSVTGQTEPEVEIAETEQSLADGLVAQVNTAQLQFRVSPGEDGEVIRLLDQDERFVVLGQNVDGSWVKLVRHGEAVGWAATQYVNLLPATAQEIEALTQPPVETAEEDSEEEGQAVQTITPGSMAIVNADYLNVRSRPAGDSDISLLAQQGQQFDITDVSDDGAWLQIAVDGEPLGWVSSDFVLVEEQGATESVAEAGTEEEAASEEASSLEETASNEESAESSDEGQSVAESDSEGGGSVEDGTADSSEAGDEAASEESTSDESSADSSGADSSGADSSGE